VNPNLVNSSPGQSLEKLVATGNVEIKFDNRLAVARQAVYITAQRMLILTGPGAIGDQRRQYHHRRNHYLLPGMMDGFTVEGGSSGASKP
jgi:hypothetical protein